MMCLRKTNIYVIPIECNEIGIDLNLIMYVFLRLDLIQYDIKLNIKTYMLWFDLLIYKFWFDNIMIQFVYIILNMIW